MTYELDFHPGMGMRWEVTHTAEETSGEMFRSMNWLDPRMPGPPLHEHPDYEESFEVHEGILDICVDGAWRQVGPGETATVPPGVPHTLRNATDEAVVVATVTKPAGITEQSFHELHRLIQEGKIKRLPPKEPRSAIYAAMLFSRYPAWFRSTKPPNQVFMTLARVGKTFRPQALGRSR